MSIDQLDSPSIATRTKPPRTVYNLAESHAHYAPLPRSPRWVAIIGTTVMLRTVALPLVIMQMKNTVKLGQAKPEIERLAARAKMQARLTTPTSPSPD